MKILHTSDWHLDSRLCNLRRTAEHGAFLNWLRETIRKEKVELLVVAGDIFDNRTPTLESQERYVTFLMGLHDDCIRGESVCRNVVLIGGNHDSAAFLEIPKPILKHLRIHVVARKPENWGDLVLEMRDDTGRVEAVVAALPFLSDVDLRRSVEGETTEEKNRHLMEGLRDAYQTLAEIALEKRNALPQGGYVPLIATGHLFTQGGEAGDGVREIYTVGNLEKFPAAWIPEVFDYTALGHLHLPQIAGGRENVRYSGSPIPVGFQEAKTEKQVVFVEWDAAGNRIIETRNVPRFQVLKTVSGDWPELETALKTLRMATEPVWLQVRYTGEEFRAMLQRDVEAILEGSLVILLNLLSTASGNRGLTPRFSGETLESLEPLEVFRRVLDTCKVPDEEREEYIRTYQEVLEL